MKSQFWYHLDLPHRWNGALGIEYSGIRFLSGTEETRIRSEIGSLSKDLTIRLTDNEIAHLQRQLNEEKKFASKLGELAASLSKELYCLSSISNALVQQRTTEEVLTRVLEDILHLLVAKLGVIYFPGNHKCVALKSPRSSVGNRAFPWLRQYYEGADCQPDNSDERYGLLVRPVADHWMLPSELKGFLKSQQIESVMEFSLRCDHEVVGRGMLGFEEASPGPAARRLLGIALNMVGLFVEHMNLMEDLERQVKLLSQQKLDKKKKQRFLRDWGTEPASWRETRTSRPVDLLLEEIERSRSMALLGKLASGVAHQIRTPLGNLVYGLHLLRQDGVSEAEKETLMEAVTERVETMNRMINDFIEYTRIPEPKLARDSINQLLTNTLRSFKGWMELAKIELYSHLDSDLPQQRVDGFLMDQAFHNIIKNAIEAMSEGGLFQVSTQKRKMRHGPEPRLEFAEILFLDDGPGIPPTDLDRVTHPFFSRKLDGMGLGLALTEHIVRAHGGALTIRNRSEGGVAIAIHLPIR